MREHLFPYQPVRPAMPGTPRRDVIAPDEVAVYHCMNRCVRRAYLCGRDDVMEQSSSIAASGFAPAGIAGRAVRHRGAGLYSIDWLRVMNNHVHVNVRSRAG
jgi:hypothetical protein